MATTIDLTNLTLLSRDDERVGLTGSYDADQLTRLFVYHWVPFFECHKCGRHDYCKFTQPSPYAARRDAGKLAEIQCGVVVTMIENYTHGTFPLLGNLTPEELQDFLDGSYHLVQFVYDAELQIGMAIDPSFIKWLGNPEYRAEFFGQTAHLRGHLDRFAGAVRGIEFLRTKTTVILTEGPSEKYFLEGLSASRLGGFTGLEVHSYYGSGNRGRTKLELLALRLHQQGYELFIQGDCDGKIRNIFQHLVREGLVEAKNTFAFRLDFESAFPPDILLSALHDMGELPNVEIAEFQSAVSGRDPAKSVLAVLEEGYDLQVNKVQLAEYLAFALVRDSELPALWEPKSLLASSEIGEFLSAIQRLP